MNCNFTSNHATEYGGAIYQGSASEECVFTDNPSDLGDSDNYNTTITKFVLSVDNFTSSYNSGNKFIISLTDYGNLVNNAESTIMVYQDNVLVGTYHCSSDGWIVDMDAGNYTVVCSVKSGGYLLDPVYATLTISKSTVNIIASAVSTTYNGNDYLIVNIKDTKNNPISGADVIINLNGAKTLKTDKNGQARLSLNGLTPREYNAIITFNENGNYYKSTKSVKISIAKATTKLTASKKTFKLKVKTKKYAVTLKTADNKAIKNVKVTIKVKGKTYTAKTNAKGQATFKLTKLTKKGTFKATVKFKGDANYRAVSKTVKITVKK